MPKKCFCQYKYNQLKIRTLIYIVNLFLNLFPLILIKSIVHCISNFNLKECAPISCTPTLTTNCVLIPFQTLKYISDFMITEYPILFNMRLRKKICCNLIEFCK